MTQWRVVGTARSGAPISVAGMNPWDHEWRTLAEAPVSLPHPQYPEQLHRMTIYEVNAQGRSIRFAAGELSNNIWGFYLPAEDQ